MYSWLGMFGEWHSLDLMAIDAESQSMVGCVMRLAVRPKYVELKKTAVIVV